jgi:hypothetical protein
MFGYLRNSLLASSGLLASQKVLKIASTSLENLLYIKMLTKMSKNEIVVSTR